MSSPAEVADVLGHDCAALTRGDGEDLGVAASPKAHAFLRRHHVPSLSANMAVIANGLRLALDL